MSEPSKEAMDRAKSACSNDWWHTHAVAIALQELMDERDAQLQARAELLTYYDAMKQRAEAAEAKLAECVRRVKAWPASAVCDSPGALARFYAMLDDYEPKTEEPGR